MPKKYPILENHILSNSHSSETQTGTENSFETEHNKDIGKICNNIIRHPK